MSGEDKKIIKSIIEAISLLPDNKQQYILGFAEGVIAMRPQQQAGAQGGG